MNKQDIINGVRHWTAWWIEQRERKLSQQLSHTMAVNPFLMPFLNEFHDLNNLEELIGLMIQSHLMVGHNTGFGKLVDEKFLPNVFGTIKLDKNYRGKTEPYLNSCFDEIDHIVQRPDGTIELLSLKAGRWTIQLTMAVQLNKAFKEILDSFGEQFDDIAVGVFYGKEETLTDKYDIIRGINRGANHDVFDLQGRVSVYCGAPFWDWLSGESGTQELVLQGILDALSNKNIRERNRRLLQSYSKNVIKEYDNLLDQKSGMLDWFLLLSDING